MDRVSIAVNNRIKKSDAWDGDLCFIDVSMFGKSTEPIGEALDKGMTVQIDGRLQFQSWEGKDDRTTTRMRSLLARLEDIMQLISHRVAAWPRPCPSGAAHSMISAAMTSATVRC